MTMHNDDDLRARFRSLAEEEAASAPPFTKPRVAPRRLLSSGGVLALVGASAAIAMITLTIGLVWGTNTGYASGRVEGDRQRNEIVANAIGATNQLGALRLALARTRADLASRTKQPVSAASLAAADAELRAMEASIGRIELDLTQGPSGMIAPQPNGIPMKRALAITCGALAIGAQQTPATVKQQGVPVIDLPQPTVKAPTTFGGLIGVRQVAAGKVLVNDGGKRMIKLFDSTLTNSTLVSDSTQGTSTYYGPYGMDLIRYLGDSSLFADFPSQTILVLNADGVVVRALAPPGDPHTVNSLIGGRSGAIDDKGRLLYASNQGTKMLRGYDPVSGKSFSQVTEPPDSIAVVRADLDSRQVDTVGRVLRSNNWRMSFVPNPKGGPDLLKYTINPVREFDNWAVLSDGTIAFVRGHDYHIDWIHPDGSKSSTAKLPFDWKRLTDADKQALVDSARQAQEEAARRTALNALKEQVQRIAGGAPPDGGGRGQRGAGGSGGGGGGGRGGPQITEFVPLGEIADYYPPIREGASMPDLDGNLWILPTTSAQSKNGELVYDVINPKRGLFERVRLPAGRSVVGFGKGGIVYLMTGDRTSGFYLERTKLPRAQVNR